MPFIDTHTHLLHDKYGDSSPEARLDHAELAGVKHQINIACHPSEWTTALDFVRLHHPRVTTSVGLHPQEVHEYPLEPALTKLETFLTNPHVVALGETGLDYHYDTTDKQEQFKSFHKHLELCKQYHLPAIIHTRDAEEDTLAILAEHPGTPFVIHCFSGTQKLADKALVLGGYISFSGILTFKKAQDIRDIAATIPHNRLLLETDAPYLAPEPHRSQTNESALMPHTATVLAKVTGLSVEQIAHITTQNAYNLFTRLPKAA